MNNSTTSDLLNWIDAWQSSTVLVIGDAILDSYLNGRAERLCRDAPAPVVAVHQRQDIPGGAANTATNVASLGGKASLLSVIGSDREGERLRFVLEQRGVATVDLLTHRSRETLVKQRVVADSQILVRLDQGSTEAISPELEQQLIDRLMKRFPDSDAVIVSDYSYGILTPRVIETLTDLQARHPRTLVVDARHLKPYRAVGATAVKPNYDETIQLLGLPKQINGRVDQIAPHGQTLLNLTGARIVAVTLDTEGALIFESQTVTHTPARPAPSNQTSGAGDTFISAFTLALTAGTSTSTAAAIAATATGVVVQQSGTTACHVQALRQSLMRNHIPDKLVTDQSDLATLIQQYQTADYRIIFTNGCFDILHPGHVAYLTQAKVLGDVLIVGVNTDESVRRLKGESRPVNPLADRLAVLSALSCVDHVVPFSELTPHNLIRIICPHVYVKGGDYTRDTLPETDLIEELGGIVTILPYVDNRSTTQLIHQIRALHL